MPFAKGKKAHTKDQRLDIIKKASVKIADTDISIYDIAKSLGIGPATFDYWSSVDEEIRAIFEDACASRAWRYYEIARKELDKIEAFYTDSDGKIKERMQSVNACKFRFEGYRRLAADLSPEKFGDRAKDLKDMLKAMQDIQQKLSDK